MRDATSINDRADKRQGACRGFLRAFAIALAVTSFTVHHPATAQAQSAGAAVQDVHRLAQFDRKTSAKLVAERIDDLAVHPASRADVETLRELVDALKDELDAANIRIDRLQERLDAAASAQSPAPPELMPNENLGTPLDPLAAAFARISRVAARLWGTSDVNMALALAGLDHSFVATTVDAGYLASLDPSDLPLAHGDVGTLVFAHTAIPMLYAQVAFRPWAPELRAARPVVARVAAPDAKAADSRIGLDLRAPVLGQLPIAEAVVPHIVAGRIPVLARAASSGAPLHSRLASTLQTNAEFDHALRAAGEFSAIDTNQQISSAYPLFNPFEQSSLGNGGFAYRSYVANLRGAMPGTITIPLKLGRAKLTTKTSLQHLEGAAPDTAGSASVLAPVPTAGRSRYEAATVDTSFVVPAFHKNVTINVRGGYDHLHHPDTTTLPYYPYDAATDGAGNSNASSLAAPNTADVERYTYGASAAVPVAHNLNVGVGYSSQHLSGTYGVAAGEPPADRKDAYSGSLTYAPHDGKSSVTIVGREYRYSDDSSPSAAFKETRGDVLFSMKF